MKYYHNNYGLVYMKEKTLHILTIEELKKQVGRVVFVEDLTIQSQPKEVYSAFIFNWQLKDLYANNFNATQDVKPDTIIAARPAALAKCTQYFYEEDYGKEWVAYEYE